MQSRFCETSKKCEESKGKVWQAKHTNLRLVFYGCCIQHCSVVNGNALFYDPFADPLQLCFTIGIGKVQQSWRKASLFIRLLLFSFPQVQNCCGSNIITFFSFFLSWFSFHTNLWRLQAVSPLYHSTNIAGMLCRRDNCSVESLSRWKQKAKSSLHQPSRQRGNIVSDERNWNWIFLLAKKGRLLFLVFSPLRLEHWPEMLTPVNQTTDYTLCEREE